ncbi:GNAT family N-acetyltransferase [Catenuloplanes sp. NPDC051500]|uniref:GNAT family N-acetyltransferase n=1 Tax=Catenuloplanes sp. NPDC051500 TaxID=3363959 RepID=UPI0037BD2C02
MTDALLDDLAPQLALNRTYWLGWNGGSGDPDADLPVYRTGIPHALLNGVARVRGLPIKEAIEEAHERLAGTRWIWWVGADSDPGTAEALEAHGATAAGSVPIMARDLTALPGVPTVDGLTIGEPGDLHDYVRGYAAPNGLPEDALDLVTEREAGYRPPRGTLVRLAGRMDGRTVSTTSVLIDGDVAGLFCVATLAAYQRRGIASALTAVALRTARDAGARVITLQASSQGEPVYQRAGFRTVGDYRFFRF